MTKEKGGDYVPEDELEQIIESIVDKVYDDEPLTIKEKEILKNSMEQEKHHLKDEEKELFIRSLVAIGDREYLQSNLLENVWGLDSWEKYVVLNSYMSQIELPDSDLTGYLLQDCIFSGKLQLSPIEKMRLIKDVRLVGDWSEENYAIFVDDCLKDNSFQFDSACKRELIQELSALSIMQERKDIGDGYQFTMYERYLYAAMAQFDLDDHDKVNLISKTNDWQFIGPCLLFVPLPSEEKVNIIEHIQQQPGMTREEYFKELLACIQNSKEIGLDISQCYNLAYSANFFNLEEETVKEGELTSYAKFLISVIQNKKQEMDPDKIRSLISISEDINLIKGAVYSDEFGLNFGNKISLIADIRDEKVIEEFLKGNEVESIGYLAKSSIIMNMGSFFIQKEDKDEFIKKYIESDEYDFLDDDKLNLIQHVDDKEYIKYAIENVPFNSEKARMKLAIATGDQEYMKEYLKTRGKNLDINDQETLILEIADEQEIKKWNQRIHQIDNISELSISDAMKLPDDAMIRIYDEHTDSPQQALYSKKDYLAIQKTLEDMLGKIKPAEKGNVESELNTFLQVYQELANIPYDNYAVSREGKKDTNLQRTCRNLGCLVESQPTCVCAGYAEILRNALALKGIECKYISGLPEKDNESGHAWNQVKIGDNWFNVDLTWDRDMILELGQAGPEVLKTDSEFENHQKFCKDRTDNESKCEVSINDAIPHENKATPKVELLNGNLAKSVQALARDKKITYDNIILEGKRMKEIELQKEIEAKEKGIEI